MVELVTQPVFRLPCRVTRTKPPPSPRRDAELENSKKKVIVARMHVPEKWRGAFGAG